MSNKIILLSSLALDETYAVFKISFARIPHSLGTHTGPDTFHFVVFFYSNNKKLAIKKQITILNYVDMMPNKLVLKWIVQSTCHKQTMSYS